MVLDTRQVSEALSIASDCIKLIKQAGDSREQTALIGRLINDAVAATQPRNIFETMAHYNEQAAHSSKKRK